jgi:hypothetical protein
MRAVVVSEPGEHRFEKPEATPKQITERIKQIAEDRGLLGDGADLVDGSDMHQRPKPELRFRAADTTVHEKRDLYGVDLPFSFTPACAAIHYQLTVSAAYEREQFRIKERDHDSTDDLNLICTLSHTDGGCWVSQSGSVGCLLRAARQQEG